MIHGNVDENKNKAESRVIADFFLFRSFAVQVFFIAICFSETAYCRLEASGSGNYFPESVDK
jgi:hypothetical protein